MSLDLGGKAAPISGVDDLVAYISGAERPAEQWLLGVEHEKLGVLGKAHHAVPYYGEGGIRDILDRIARAAGSRQHAHRENGQPIALIAKDASVTLEPGGQLELSGAPWRSFAAIARELDEHLEEVRQDSGEVRWLGAGYRPFGTRDDVQWMPKGRYGAMKDSLGPRGRLALDMMLMTATVQANLDWSSEEDLAEKARVATAVSPIVTAIFANSPLINGRESGFLDFRYQVWKETDDARCGLLEQMFEPGWTYRKYVDWALDVPMLFIRNGTDYQLGEGQTFRNWLETGRLKNGTERTPRLNHWADHLSTLFPEVRIKRVLELRGADVVPRRYLLALPALWVGLLYDPAARKAALELARGFTFPSLLQFQSDVARLALAARAPSGHSALDLGRELVAIAHAGLASWDAAGVEHLLLLDDILEPGKTLAERALEIFRSSGNDPESLIRFWQIA